MQHSSISIFYRVNYLSKSNSIIKLFYFRVKYYRVSLEMHLIGNSPSETNTGQSTIFGWIG